MQKITDIVSGKTQLHLASLDNKCLIHTEIMEPFNLLKAAAGKQGFDLRIASGFRSYERQLLIWNEKALGKREVLDYHGQSMDFHSLSFLFYMGNWPLCKTSSLLPGVVLQTCNCW